MTNAHFLHVSYQKTVDDKTYCQDSLVILTADKNLAWVREALRKSMSQYFQIELKTCPVIISMTEISEELFKILNQ